MDRKPFYSPCVINNNHHHAENLVGGYLLNNMTGIVCHDYSKNGHDCNLSENLFNSQGVYSTSVNQEGIIQNTNNSLINSEEGTILIYLKSYTPFLGGKDHMVFGFQAGSVGDFMILKNLQNRLYFIFQDDVGQHIIRIGAISTWETGTLLCVQWRRTSAIWNSDNMVFNINGDYVSPAAVSGETSWNLFNVNQSMYILNNKTNIFGAQKPYFDGEFHYFYIYNKVLSLETIKSIYQDPYAMVYKPNYLSNFIGAYAPQLLPTTMDKRHKHFGANALPIGIGL